MRSIVFELCAETIEACFAARDGGASRIELCSGLSEGGVTPSHGLAHAAITLGNLPIHILIRPRAGDFLYTTSEFAVMAQDIAHVKELGAAGVVLGILTCEGTVDTERMRSLLELARPMEVTFHRAFDATPSLPETLEDIIALGCDRVLTSGGERDVTAGSLRLAALVEQAAGRIHIAVGGGLRLHNAASLARLTGATHFHGSLRRRSKATPPVTSDGDAVRDLPLGRDRYVVEAEDVRSIILRLQRV